VAERAERRRLEREPLGLTLGDRLVDEGLGDAEAGCRVVGLDFRAQLLQTPGIAERPVQALLLTPQTIDDIDGQQLFFEGARVGGAHAGSLGGEGVSQRRAGRSAH
jgi:hypothetical protein